MWSTAARTESCKYRPEPLAQNSIQREIKILSIVCYHSTCVGFVQAQWRRIRLVLCIPAIGGTHLFTGFSEVWRVLNQFLILAKQQRSSFNRKAPV